jgi:hypothetical protein
MLDETLLEHRLTTLEQAVSDLQYKAEHQGEHQPNWLDKLIGSISDEEAFLEALEYGRAFRQSEPVMNEAEVQP